MKTDIFEKLNWKNPPDESNYSNLLEKIDFIIDKDYLNFMKNSNGGEGFLNTDNYIQIWEIKDLIALNPYYTDVPECLNYFFFGSDGSNLGYAFNKRRIEILSVDFLELGSAEPQYIAKSFKSLLEKLASE